jgi:hypothetical protein
MEKRILYLFMGGLIVIGLWSGGYASAAAASPENQGPVSLTIHDPTGAFEVTQLFAKRLDTLAGKTICELSNDDWETYRTFPAIRGLLQKQYPSARVIPYTEFPTGSFYIDSDKTAQLAKTKGCDGVIVGNAG